MPAVKYTELGKHNGSILISTLLIGLTVFGLSAVCLTMADTMLGEFTELSDAIGRENAAREAMRLARAYFISDMRLRLDCGEDFDRPAPNPSPIKEIPQSEFASIAGTWPDAVVEGVIIDLHYAGSFTAAAQRQQIPEGRPSLITVSRGRAEGDEEVFFASRYEIRTKVKLNRAPHRIYVMKQGLLVLIGAADRSLEIIHLYTEK